MSAPGLAARQAAAAMLKGVLTDGVMLGELIDALPRDLPPSGRARAQSLATMVLRHLDPIDTVLQQFLRKRPDDTVLNALRIATAEMLLDGVEPYAAVDAAVNAVRADHKTQHMTGMTNAVARNVSREGAAIWQEMSAQELPQWLRKPLMRAYGPDVVDAMEVAHAMGAPLDLTLKGDKPEGLEADYTPTGSLRLEQAHVTALPGFVEGDWWVQDAAAALPVRALGDITGLTALDLCAAPGGKTLQLSAGGADVTALDISGPRLKRVRENLERCHLSANIVTADALHWQPEQQFDIVLLDAPCTATGTIRRHPDLPYVKTGEENKGLVELQRALLARAADWVKPGGRLVFCTCSLLPSEGEVPIKRFLETRDDYSQVKIDPVALGGEEGWSLGPALRLRPDFWAGNGGMDGFYITIMTRTA